MSRLPDILPRDEGADRYLPWLIAVMVFLAELATAGGFLLDHLATGWADGLRQNLTIEIPHGGDVEQRADVLLATLRGVEGVEQARRLSPEDVSRLLQPWLGESAIVTSLPLPLLIDVRIRAPDPAVIAAVTAVVREVAPAGQVDDHQVWLGRVLRFATALQWLAVAIITLVTAATVVMVAYATRAALVAHHDIIALLHIMGARDGQIARRFQAHATQAALRGGFVGLAVAAAALYALSLFAAQLSEPINAEVQLLRRDLAVMALLPLAATGIAALTARLTVMRGLTQVS